MIFVVLGCYRADGCSGIHRISPDEMCLEWTNQDDGVTRKSFDELIIRVLQDDCTPEERAEFDQLSVSDQNFAGKVAAVKSWLDPLSEEEASQAPDENLLDDIFRSIDAADAPDG